MNSEKIATFMRLGSQHLPTEFEAGDAKRRELGASLLLSEVLEYIIKGLGVVPEVNGVKITAPDSLSYRAEGTPNLIEMLDGLADTAYTMYWNALAFGLPLEEAFELVCNNNLEKFVPLSDFAPDRTVLEPPDWHCGQEVRWPAEVATVEIITCAAGRFAVGKDARGKVKKPSTYRPLDLSTLATSAG